MRRCVCIRQEDNAVKIRHNGMDSIINKKNRLFQSIKAFVKMPGRAKSGAQTIWRSRLSWKVTFTVFTAIVITQMIIFMVVSPVDITADKRHEVSLKIKPLIKAALKNGDSRKGAPITAMHADDFFRTTELNGIAIYDLDFKPMIAYGVQPRLLSNDNAKNETLQAAADGKAYEMIFTPRELALPYFVAANINADAIQKAVWKYALESLLTAIILSALVTTFIISALSRWILEPFVVLRQNMRSAVVDPQKPEIHDLSKTADDEVSVTVHIANDLIRQNAINIAKLKEQAEDKIHKLSYYDTLTNLPNRSYFTETLDKMIKNHVLVKDKSLVVMSVDLDHFKDINDSMGHETGDMLLEAVAQRLVNATPEGSVVARSSADEFAIMVPINREFSESSEIVNRIYAAFHQPVTVAQEKFQIRASIGIAQCPQDGVDAGHIMKNADIALNRAKEDGRNTYRYYSEHFDRMVQSRFQMLRDLRGALENNQLELHYHPQFDLKSGKMIGAEALLRWWRPDDSEAGGSYVSPGKFIPVAEQSGLIVQIGEWVLRTACAEAAKWQKGEYPLFRMAVNLSGAQFHRGDIVNTVRKVLKETGLDPRGLELEVTESVFMDDVNFTANILDQLHDMGCEIAIDDFGTGYSSLSYLRQFPIDRLKIDQSFIRDALTDTDDQAITRTIINLGHSLGLKVIAEGVETQAHQDFLISENCDEAQGFKYSKPVPMEKLYDFAKAYKNDLTAPATS